MAQLDLRDLNSLYILRAAFGQFSAGTQEALQMAEAEIQRTLEWIDGRVHHWQRQIVVCQRERDRASDALRRCQASIGNSRDHSLDCREQAHALNQIEAKLRLCKENLQTTQRWRTHLDRAIQEYRREALKLHILSTDHTDKARAYLNKSVKGYEAVLQAAQMVGVGVSLGEGGLGIGVSIISKGVNLLIGRTNQAVGDAGEGIAQQVVSNELGLKIVPFDQRKRGFDGILQGPNGQYLLLESKTSEDNKLHLSADSYGFRQASADWVAHVAQLMCTPGTELYSDTNAQIGQTILQIGAQQVPMLGVVTNKQTNKVTIYLRTGGDALADDWLLLSGDNTASILLE